MSSLLRFCDTTNKLYSFTFALENLTIILRTIMVTRLLLGLRTLFKFYNFCNYMHLLMSAFYIVQTNYINCTISIISYK